CAREGGATVLPFDYW
nr:immunoglobulin heavy chain junction region [Macaca mulatta]MOW18850.1 immunoglobulin heavy chain junction region [Macaca mulatta]MOW19014.1 immunoglobulin heavy chain junction region [Macaca mulatta]MOW19118.1 immunoglobulin heavy chain junction region [Macaca mulatta]MOW19174.1 immunoglobulin heavy chain junction region [Macaca mulatta]